MEKGKAIVLNKKVLKTLEYAKVLLQLEDKADSILGKGKCKSLEPVIDIHEIEKAQLETKAALQRIFQKGSTSFGSIKDVTIAIKSVEIGSILAIIELLDIAKLLENVNRVKQYGHKELEEEEMDEITSYFEDLIVISSLVNEIRRCILSEDEISDDATPKLKQIRRTIVQTNEKIHQELNRMVNGSHRIYLQDAVITMRNQRYCIPVKVEYKGQVSGMVHDQSSSGSTFFIEPAAIVNLNNKLRELELEEKEEIQIILKQLSIQVGESAVDIINNQTIMVELDFIFAKAKLALEMNATKPIFNEKRYIHIRKGRHPLLDKKKVVPIDIYLGDKFDLLIITGPNTGGKTVSLKTVGLFTLMGQAGLHIPALDRSELAVFTEVYADIGDEQSIEQSLSTFSSHMATIVRILQEANENSLCLFDELGAGTDPTEGAALAISILNHLHEKRICTMATTHYSELKIYALSTTGVENASCEFDVNTLSPTYRLLIGIPGKSNAFAISAKLGLPEYIIESAKEQISKDAESFEDVIANLESSRLIIEKEQREIALYKEEIESLKLKLKNKNEKIDHAKDKILRQANEQARDILQEAKEIADESIRVFHKGKTDIKELEKKRDNIRSNIDKKNNKLSVKKNNQNENHKKQIDPKSLKKGDGVKVLSMGLKGIVSTLPDGKGNLFVQCGIMRTQVNIKDLVLFEEEMSYSNKVTKSSMSQIKVAKKAAISTEINLIGKSVDEALASLDKYLDDAYLSHLSAVRVVHGKGTGALRKAIQNHVKRLKYVESARMGEYGEGDAGVTIITFK